jgi:hypothetical protein
MAVPYFEAENEFFEAKKEKKVCKIDIADFLEIDNIIIRGI